MRALPILALTLVAVAGFVLRSLPARERAIDTREHAPQAQTDAHAAPQWLFDDPDSAYHVRRVELALANGRVPVIDPFLDHPSSCEIPWLPMYDTALATSAERLLHERGGDPTLAGVDEERLEDFLARTPPWIGVLGTLAMYWAVRRALTGARAAWLALLAAALFAVAPALVHAGEVARLDHLAWVATLFALHLGATLRALRARDALDAVFGALVAALVTGVLLASFEFALALFAASWLGFVWMVFFGDSERRPIALRAALLYCAATAFISHLPLSDGPWQAPGEGLLRAWSEGVSRAALFAALPFLCGFLLPGRRTGRFFQSAVFIVAIGALIYYVPSMRSGLLRMVAWQRENSDVLALLRSASEAEQHGASNALLMLVRDLTPLALAFVPAWALLCRRFREPLVLCVLATSAVSFALMLWQPRLAGLFVVPMALTLALALDELHERWPERARRWRWALVAVPAALLLVQALAPALAQPDRVLREERIEFVDGLRWMRANTPAPGAFNATSGGNEWGVLTSFDTSLLVVQHARRPTTGSALSLLAGRHSVLAASRALMSRDTAALVRAMHGEEDRYVVAGPRLLRNAATLLQLAALGGDASATFADADTARKRSEESVLWRLSMTPASAADASVPGLTRVYASTRAVTIDGRLPRPGESAGPAISIWRLDTPAPALLPAELRAR